MSHNPDPRPDEGWHEPDDDRDGWGAWMVGMGLVGAALVCAIVAGAWFVASMWP